VHWPGSGCKNHRIVSFDTEFFQIILIIASDPNKIPRYTKLNAFLSLGLDVFFIPFECN